MSISWHFNEALPGRVRESQVEKFFNSDAVVNRANAIVREGIQNSLDAAPDDAVVRVRIAVGVWTEDEKPQHLGNYANGFFDHLNAEEVRRNITQAPGANDQFRYLVFEDFGTSGLVGDPAQCFLDEHQKSNAFFNYFRAEGISNKDHGNRGRHGVGKFVFLAASRARLVFGLTCRNDGRQLLLGTTVLRYHRLEEKPYTADGWFGVPDPEHHGNVLPVEHDTNFIDQFKADFHISRRVESGLSVVVPWLADDVTVTELVKAAVTGYFHPILRNKLIVEIINETGESIVINGDTIKSVIESQNSTLATEMTPVIALAEASLAKNDRLILTLPVDGAPKWLPACISEDVRLQLHAKREAGELVAMRVPMQMRQKGNDPVDCHFDIFLQGDTSIGDGQIIFIREGIIISDVRPRRTSGVRALVVVDEGPLATFLGDAENPSHTQWQKELVRDKYSFHAATIDYVVQSVPSILQLLSDDQKKPDTSLLIDLFSLPADDGLKTKEKRKKKKDGGETDEPEIDLPVKPKRFTLQKLKDGFEIRRGDQEAARPNMLAIKMAYGVRRGSPFTRYNPADFRIGLGGIECHCTGCDIVDFEDNWMNIQVKEEDFEIDVTGFDVKRDLHVDVKVTETEVADASTT